MSFRAVISDPERQQLWYRTVNVLSTIYEDIRLTITPTELIAWSINSTDTTLCKVRFSSKFFEQYDFQPREIIFGESGVQTATDSSRKDHKIYSLQINGRHLSTISRKPDSDAIKNFTIAINNTSSCPDTLVNRLLVHVEMESLLSKEYTPQFQPILYDPIIIDLKYKRNFLDVYGSANASSNGSDEQLDPKLLDIFKEAREELSSALFNDEPMLDARKEERLTVADEINYICCSQALLKNFIDNCNANVTEEFKVEISVHKLVMTAFTNAIYGKNNDILKNTMSLSNTISVNDLEHYCLFTTTDDAADDTAHRKDQTKTIVFKLKDFKNFLSIGSTWRTAQNENLNIWFCHGGDPILIEMKKNGVTLELVQVTDNNGSIAAVEDHLTRTVISKTISPEKKRTQGSRDNLEASRTSPLKNPKYTVENRRSPLKEHLDATLTAKPPKKLFVADESQETTTSRQWRSSGTDWVDGDALSRESTEPAEEPTTSAPVRAERTGTTIEWGKRSLEPEESFSTLDRQSVLKREKLKHFQALKESEESEGLGPTQVSKPKGLFD